MMMSGTTGWASGGSKAKPGRGSSGLIGHMGAARLEKRLAKGGGPCRGLVDPRQIAGLARAITAVPGLQIPAEIAAHLDRAVALRPGGSAPVVGRLGGPIPGERFR